MNLLKAISLLLVLCAAATSAQRREPELSATMRTAHFIVHYDPEDPFLAKLLAEAAEDELTRVARDLGMRRDQERPFQLYVYPTHMGFIRAGGLETRKFTVGTARGDTEAISVDASGVFAQPQQVLAHEITHAAIFRIVGPSAAALPLWMNEGLAEYESQEKPSEDDLELVAEAAAAGTLIHLHHLATFFPEDRTALAYAVSSSAVRYMVREYGKDAPRVLLSELARTGSFEKAMLKATGTTPSRFERDWLEHTTRRYWGLKIARAGAATISAIMAILAIAAFLARRRAKREAARRWEEEEMMQPPPWFPG